MFYFYKVIDYRIPRHRFSPMALPPLGGFFYVYMQRVIFYFDGLNYYNGIRDKAAIDAHWKNYYWLDFVAFCRLFLIEGQHELIKVRYFTSPPVNQEKRSRQSALLSANKILHPGVFQVHSGNHQEKFQNCPFCKKTFAVFEEKRTDVGIAVQMVLDCLNDEVDLLVLVSADSDQIPALQAIHARFPQKTVKVYFPPERYSTEIFQLAKPVVFLNENEGKYKKSVMPPAVAGGNKLYTRPPGWKI